MANLDERQPQDEHGPRGKELCGKVGGHARNRTGMHGFAIRCVTTPPRGLTNGAIYCRIRLSASLTASAAASVLKKARPSGDGSSFIGGAPVGAEGAAMPSVRARSRCYATAGSAAPNLGPARDLCEREVPETQPGNV